MGRFSAQWIAAVLFGAVLHKAVGTNTTYVVALLGQDVQNGSSNAAIEYQLVIVNGGLDDIDVEIKGVSGPIQTMTVGSMSTTIYSLNYTMGMNGSEFSNKSLTVQSENGKFVLQVFTKRNDFVEGLLAIPIEEMNGTNQLNDNIVYGYVVATFCAVGGYCQVAIAAAENNTEVFIDIPSNVEEIALCNKSSYYRSTMDKRITMNQYDALQLETTYDLTGTVIFSYKPIAVFAGSRYVKNGNVFAHTMEQLVPTSHWGKEFIVQNLGSNGYGDILKIVSHFTSTTVTMSSFPSFNIKDRYHTVTRRLGKGMRSHIKASHPIQVIQITGLTYATKSETFNLGMTVVPSIQNAWKKFTIACPENTTAQFHIVSEKGSCTGTKAVAMPYPNSGKYNGYNGYPCSNPVYLSRIKYSQYMIGTIVKNVTKGDVLVIENEQSFVSGIVKCGQTATMPVGVLYNENATGTILTSIPEYPGGICYEGGKAATKFFPKNGSVVPYILNLTNYETHVFKLRVQVCGSAVVRFMNSFNDSIVARLNYENIRIIACTPECNLQDTDNFTSDSFNEEAGKGCTSDMSFFWFWRTGETFCLGTGYNHNKDCVNEQGQNNTVRIQTEHAFDQVSMMGTFANASFNWDFIHVNGCKEYEFGWRCADRLVNCSLYEDGFCTDPKYNVFASYYCAKFCGKCFADSYGQKFLLRTPKITVADKDCLMIVSPLNKQTNVAVTLRNVFQVENVQHGKRYDNGERYYNCTSSLMLDTYTILSDGDVAVVVLINFSGEIKSTRVYPVDTFGTDFMVLEYNDNAKTCLGLSEHDSVDFVAYYSIGKQQKSKNDSKKAPLDKTSLLETVNDHDMSGTIFKFDKPSTVFCGDTFLSLSATVAIHYNQHLPTNTWSTEYVVPAFDVEAINRPFDGKLLIVSNADNTIVNISGGFDAIHAIYNRGDKIEQEIDVGAAYRIKASEKIGVGLYLYDPNDPKKSSFHVLPPLQNLHDTVLTSIPRKALRGIGYNVGEIQTFSITPDMKSTKASKDKYIKGRYISKNDVKYEMTMVQSDDNKWFVVPGNIKAKDLTMPQKKPCDISTASHNDGKDNDCDGLTDEDGYYSDKYGVYKQDHDLDGDFGEDYGGDLITSSVVVLKPKEPECFEIKNVSGQCWKAWRCPCSWVEKLNKNKNLTREQLLEVQQQQIEQYRNALQLNKSRLTSTRAQKNSAKDKRKSAESIGYVGISLFAIVFGLVLILDIRALKRDFLILKSNLTDGFDSLQEWFEKRFCKKNRQPADNVNDK